MNVIDNIKTGIANTLRDPLGTSIGVAWWVLCVGLGAWFLQIVLGFVFRINGV